MSFKILKHFIAWIKQAGYEKNYQPILKLSHTVHSKKLGHEICVVQIIGKNAFAELEAQYLVTHPKILRAFSHEDVVKITQLSDSVKNTATQKTVKIREINTHGSEQKKIVIIEQPGESKKLRAVSLNEIENNKALLSKFKPEEAFRLGHTKAMQDVEEEQEAINKIKKENKKSKLIYLKSKSDIYE